MILINSFFRNPSVFSTKRIDPYTLYFNNKYNFLNKNESIKKADLFTLAFGETMEKPSITTISLSDDVILNAHEDPEALFELYQYCEERFNRIFRRLGPEAQEELTGFSLLRIVELVNQRNDGNSHHSDGDIARLMADNELLYKGRVKIDLLTPGNLEEVIQQISQQEREKYDSEASKFDSLTEIDFEKPGSAAETLIVSPDAQPEDTVYEMERQELLADLVGDISEQFRQRMFQLPRVYRVIGCMSLLENFTPEEIAEKLDISVMEAIKRTYLTKVQLLHLIQSDLNADSSGIDELSKELIALKTFDEKKQAIFILIREGFETEQIVEILGEPNDKSVTAIQKSLSKGVQKRFDLQKRFKDISRLNVNAAEGPELNRILSVPYKDRNARGKIITIREALKRVKKGESPSNVAIQLSTNFTSVYNWMEKDKNGVLLIPLSNIYDESSPLCQVMKQVTGRGTPADYGLPHSEWSGSALVRLVPLLIKLKPYRDVINHNKANFVASANSESFEIPESILSQKDLFKKPEPPEIESENLEPFLSQEEFWSLLISHKSKIPQIICGLPEPYQSIADVVFLRGKYTPQELIGNQDILKILPRVSNRSVVDPVRYLFFTRRRFFKEISENGDAEAANKLDELKKESAILATFDRELQDVYILSAEEFSIEEIADVVNKSEEEVILSLCNMNKTFNKRLNLLNQNVSFIIKEHDGDDTNYGEASLRVLRKNFSEENFSSWTDWFNDNLVVSKLLVGLKYPFDYECADCGRVSTWDKLSFKNKTNPTQFACNNSKCSKRHTITTNTQLSNSQTGLGQWLKALGAIIYYTFGQEKNLDINPASLVRIRYKLWSGLAQYEKKTGIEVFNNENLTLWDVVKAISNSKPAEFGKSNKRTGAEAVRLSLE